MSNFQEKLQKYADVCIQVGSGLREGQRMVLRAPLEAREFAHALTRAAYRAGAKFVDIIWTDQTVSLIRLQESGAEYLSEASTWGAQLVADYMDNGDALFSIAASDPDLLAGQDADRINQVTQAANKAARIASLRISSNKSNWSLAAAPIPGWTKKVFPQLSPEEGEAKLWELIFDMCRINTPDPIGAWKQHTADLTARVQHLNNKAYHALHYKGRGTDLTVGLPAGHIWSAANMKAQNGVVAVANIPTEEAFTLADRTRIDGYVASTKPLSYNGTLIEDFTLHFRGGQVVSAEANKGNAVLQNLLNTDEGARSFGEVALVPHSSPISRSGVMFYNTLFDENASCHFALGRAYSFTLEGGIAMSEEQFRAAGGNTSLVHVDFMVGSETMDIDGITADGQREAVMRAGEWAF